VVLLKIQLSHRNWQLGVALNFWGKIRGQTLVSMFYFVNFIATHGGRVQISVHPRSPPRFIVCAIEIHSVGYQLIFWIRLSLCLVLLEELSHYILVFCWCRPSRPRLIEILTA